jgi:hypothetical protein
VLGKYPEIRDRIFELSRLHGLRPDFPETTRIGRALLLWSPGQIVVARAFIPTVADPPFAVLARLERDLSGVFGEGWMK